MNPRARLAYSNRDYEAIRRELLARIPQLTERWTDFNESDLGVVLLELFCGIGDMLAYYLDVQANEAYLPTARQRQSVINLCKLIAYKLDGPIAATTEIAFTLPQVLDEDVQIPAGTICRAQLDDGSNVDFVTAEDGTIPAGQRSISIGAEQGTRKTLVRYTGTGLPNQRFNLPDQGVALGSVVVQSNRRTPEYWTEVRHFQESGRTDRHFSVDYEGLGQPYLTFGDGISGQVPFEAEALDISYLITLGAGGNLGRNMVDTLVSPIRLHGTPVNLIVTNPIPATGGNDPESLEHARRQAPAELATLWKAVTKADYLALAEGFPGVAKAQVLDTNDCRNIRYYQVNLAVAPDGGGLPSPLLKGELLAFLEARKVITIEIRLFDPRYLPVNIDATIWANEGASLDTVRTACQTALTDYFAFDRQAFEQSVYLSDLIALLDNTSGVSHVVLNTPTVDIVARPGEICTLGTVNLTMRRQTY